MAIEIDFRSETWRAFEAIAIDRIEKHRIKNDGQLNTEDTARLRGRIAELKELLTLGKPSPALVADES